MSDAVFSWRSITSTTTFSAFLDDVLVPGASFTAATDGTTTPPALGKFYGFEGIVFDEIRLTIADSDRNFTLDNLQFNVAAIPLPAALPLFASALAGFGFFGWRRKRAAAA